jgi:hypothetical protein
METENLIRIEVLCSVHNIDISFLHSLKASGLAELIVQEESLYVHTSQIGHIEKMIRLHYELDINLEGLEVVGHLLAKVEALLEENRSLRNRLGRFEDGL